MSVRKRGQSWVADWTDGQRKRHQLTFKVKKDAEAFHREQLRLRDRGQYLDPQEAKRPLREFFDPWLRTTANIKPVTRKTYVSVWRSVVSPRWGDVQIRSITFADVRDWTSNCTSSSGNVIGDSQIRKASSVLAMILDYCVELNVIPKNPARPDPGSRRDYLPRKKERDTSEILSEEEIERLARACGPYDDLIRILAHLGLRFGEATALKPEDIDFELGRILVRRTLSVDDSGKIIQQSPKNGKQRVVPLIDRLRTPLASRALRTQGGSLLFTSPLGEPIRHQNFTRRVWKPALLIAGVSTSLTMHQLRHTAASLAIAKGCNVLEVSQLLGHASASLTLDTYSHLFADSNTTLAARLNATQPQSM